MFEVNDNIKVHHEILLESDIYIVDNFFKDPTEIVEFLIKTNPQIWKEFECPSYNTIHFLDRRHTLKNENIAHIKKTISSMTNSSLFDDPTLYFTNCMKLFKSEFNDYKNNYWCPHTDPGYTAIIYLNKDTFSGTNLYEQVSEDYFPGPEHYAPWRSKSKYKLIKNLQARFNRLVIFNGRKFLHGMAVDDDRFFLTERMNMVLFFESN